MVSELFDADAWRPVAGFEDLADITYHRAVDVGVVRVAFDRPEIRNAFRPRTVDELYRVLDHARQISDVGCVLLTGNGPSPRDGGWAFCSGGDQRIRGKDGYRYAEGDDAAIDRSRPAPAVSTSSRCSGSSATMPKVVICLVPGWAAGGGHSLHVVCDLTLASREHARFRQTDADVASLRRRLRLRLPGPPGRPEVRPGDLLPRRHLHRRGRPPDGHGERRRRPRRPGEGRALAWGRRIMGKSPTAQRMAKFALNLIDDGLVGQQVFAGEATRLVYGTDEAVEGRDAFLEKRDPDWSPYPWHY